MNISSYPMPYRFVYSLQCHDEKDECKVGDVVRVEECRPMSKRKKWVVTNILRRAQTLEGATGGAEEELLAAAGAGPLAAGFAASAVGKR